MKNWDCQIRGADQKEERANFGTNSTSTLCPFHIGTSHIYSQTTTVKTAGLWLDDCKDDSWNVSGWRWRGEVWAVRYNLTLLNTWGTAGFSWSINTSVPRSQSLCSLCVHLATLRHLLETGSFHWKWSAAWVCFGIGNKYTYYHHKKH